MTPSEYPAFTERLVQLADALGSRPPTQAGIALWVQTLKEFPFAEVSDQLDGWAKRSTKFPAPADVWKPCNEIRTARIEATAKSEAILFNRQAERTFVRSGEFGRRLRALLASMKDRPENDPKDWARIIHHRFINDLPGNHGEPINQVQLEFACSALRLNLKDVQ